MDTGTSAARSQLPHVAVVGERVETMTHARAPEWDHVWWWKCRLPERRGDRCRVLVRGTKNNVLVQFEDGVLIVTSRYAVRRAK